MGVLSGIDDLTGWTLLQKNSAAIEKSYMAGSSSASDIAYFKSIASTLTSPAKLLSNYRALTFVTTAFGMSGQQNETALLKDLMTQNPLSSKSLAQQLGTSNILQFATSMSNWSPPPFSTAAGINKVIAGYQQNSFDVAVGQDNTTLQNALYFTQNAKGATSLLQLMANSTLLAVVTGALGIPSSFGYLSFDQQEAMLKPLVNMKQFSTTAGVASFVNKYIDMSEVNDSSSSSSSSSSGSPLTALFNSSSNGSSITQGLTITAGMTGTGSTLNLLA